MDFDNLLEDVNNDLQKCIKLMDIDLKNYCLNIERRKL